MKIATARQDVAIKKNAGPKKLTGRYAMKTATAYQDAAMNNQKECMA